MKTRDALKIINEFYNKSNPSEDEAFAYTEALSFLIEETKSPKYMMELGGYYYEEKRFDLALKYYEWAAEYDYESAYVCLGYIWYYGRTGERDFEKAFNCYKKAADLGNIVCKYKLADMYKNGYYVEKDYEKYKGLIEELYPAVKDAHSLGEPLPEIFTRLARIRIEEGKKEEAEDLLYTAKDFLAQRISYNAFFGNLNIMKWLIEDLYGKLAEFDEDDFDFYDLYYLLKKPVDVEFRYNGKKQTIKAEEEEDGSIAICFNGKWFRTVDDFFAKACIGNDRLTAIYDDLYDFGIADDPGMQ